MPRIDFYDPRDGKPILSVRLDAPDLLVGRAPECAVQIPGAKVSRHHLRIRTEEDGHRLRDLSRNGTRINAGWVRGEVRLVPGDRVCVGDRVFVHQPDGAPLAELSPRAIVGDSEAPG
ncbi:MAG: FHA domain-containing protein [Thermoanaerobaculia bacterium]|nr:FHA domain-containing protein [Thermoanaerobaculia bacterium]